MELIEPTFIFMVLNCELTYVFIPFVSDIANVATV